MKGKPSDTSGTFNRIAIYDEQCLGGHMSCLPLHTAWQYFVTIRPNRSLPPITSVRTLSNVFELYGL